jgi:AAA domain (dynein-related subfamily)
MKILKITSKPSPTTKPVDANLAEDINKFLGEDKEGDFDLAPTGQAVPPGSPEDILRGKKELDSFDRRIFEEEEEDWEIQLKDAMIEGTEALLIVGESGVGKTTMINQLAAKYLKTPVAYFNCPTMDPFIHLVGIPDISENKETGSKVLNFVRKAGVEQSELLVLDEINRVPAATQNALFELVATQKINGEKVGLVRMVWGAMNPPRSDIEGVSVEDVEAAFRGRFHEVIPVLAKPKMRHYFGNNGIGAHIAHACLRWWYQFIEGKKDKNTGYMLKDIVTPRVLEYIMIKLQKLENRKNGLGDPRHGPMTDRIWNANFDTITHHAKLSKDTIGISLPFPELKQALMGNELFAISSLMDHSSEVDAKIKEMSDPNRPDAAKMACTVIAQAIHTDKLTPHPLIAWDRIGEFSKVLTSVPLADAEIVITGQPKIAGYLFAKCMGNDQIKRDFSNNNPNHSVWKKPTMAELSLFKFLEYPITTAVKKSLGKNPALKTGGPGAGVPKPGGAPSTAFKTANRPTAASGTPGTGTP